MSGESRILARSNFSLGAGGLMFLLLSLGSVTLGLAGVMAWQGYWPIMLFAFLQLILVALILVRAWQNAWVIETICIDSKRVTIVQQRHDGRRERDFDSAWARIRVEKHHISWYPPRVSIHCKSESLELGSFLTHEERLSLASMLAQALSEHSAWNHGGTQT